MTLWQDDLRALARIAPGIDPARPDPESDGRHVRRWTEPFADRVPADVVIEAFGCGLPERYVEAMARAAAAPAWFILEYLSAETWVDNAHGLPSPHPRLPLPRRFWFPGFTAKTGGLLRERGMLAARDAFRRDDAAQRALWSALGGSVPGTGRNPHLAVLLSESAVAGALSTPGPTATTPSYASCRTASRSGALDLWTAGNVPHPGHPFHRGRLTLHAIPFVPQDDYDRLLWCSSVNFVRGEDSFVRAQWAARACAWHIYPQAEAAHWAKLEAFLARYTARTRSGDSTRRAGSVLAGLERRARGPPDRRRLAGIRRGAAGDRPACRALGDGPRRPMPDLASGLVKAARLRYN